MISVFITSVVWPILIIVCFSDSGEMCAMKEVTLFLDDPKSKESAKQLGQVLCFKCVLHRLNTFGYMLPCLSFDIVFISLFSSLFNRKYHC